MTAIVAAAIGGLVVACLFLGVIAANYASVLATERKRLDKALENTKYAQESSAGADRNAAAWRAMYDETKKKLEGTKP